MKLFHFHGPVSYDFAYASRRGTWYPKGGKICSECGASRQKRVSPLILEWEPGSDVIGDFVWPGFDDELVVTQKVKDDFEGHFREIEFSSVEFWQNPKQKQPIKKTRRSKPRVWLPYMGPILWDVRPVKWCHLDLLLSNVIVTKKCSTCGAIFHKVPTTPRRHLVVDLATWAGEDLFRLYESPRFFFCTEQVKEFVEQAGFSNVSFLEDGIIPI